MEEDAEGGTRDHQGHQQGDHQGHQQGDEEEQGGDEEEPMENEKQRPDMDDEQGEQITANLNTPIGKAYFSGYRGIASYDLNLISSNISLFCP
jgi:hypothetical protein